jgi:hypothetical protein
MIIDDFPICNDASLFTKDFREDLLANFETRHVIFCLAAISSHLMSKKLGFFAPRSQRLACSTPLLQKMLLQLSALGNLMQ